MMVEDACGTVVDYLIHERMRKFRKRVIITWKLLRRLGCAGKCCSQIILNNDRY